MAFNRRPGEWRVDALSGQIMDKMRTAKYTIGQVVKHRLFSFRGVIFDIDPVFNNTEEWWQAIPAEIRPRTDDRTAGPCADGSQPESPATIPRCC